MLAWFPNAMPLQGLIGGLLIGLASAIMLLSLGRIAGVSGLVAQSLALTSNRAPRLLPLAFIFGLPLGAFLISLTTGPLETQFPDTPITLIVGGLLVGFGTRLGSGCTSGHGVCGLSRLSRRSLVATALFMASGFATVAAMRFGGLL
jgi:uncharacterized membrane protein YedE/YeeE